MESLKDGCSLRLHGSCDNFKGEIINISAGCSLRLHGSCDNATSVKALTERVAVSAYMGVVTFFGVRQKTGAPVAVSAYMGVVTKIYGVLSSLAVVAVSAYMGVVTSMPQFALLQSSVAVSAYMGVVTVVTGKPSGSLALQSPPTWEL